MIHVPLHGTPRDFGEPPIRAGLLVFLAAWAVALGVPVVAAAFFL